MKNKMEDLTMCQHKWIYQETQKKTHISYNGNGNYTAYFYRVDVYYCENCCEIKEIKKQEKVYLPFGGKNHVHDFAPVWY